MKQLVVEGWRRSSHSYALVNQHQLLHLVNDQRFALFHFDVPFYRPHWAQLDAGFPDAATAILNGLPAPSAPRTDVIYRISWPLRVHAGPAQRVFVFGTCEFDRFRADSMCGLSGTERDVDFKAVEIVTPSRWSRAGFLALGFSEEQVHVVPHGIDPLVFESSASVDRQEVRAALNIPQDAFVFLNIGAMTWNKGIGLLLAAFARHRLRHEQAILLLKGGDSLYGNLMGSAIEEAKKLYPDVAHPKVAASIRYLPHNLPQAGLAKLYPASDVYISPYRAEGFNLPVLEALASGIPVIVTAGGSTDDFCAQEACLKIEASPANGVHGRYLEPDVDSVVECMQRITDDALPLREAARRGVRDVFERYSWQAVTHTLGDLLCR